MDEKENYEVPEDHPNYPVVDEIEEIKKRYSNQKCKADKKIEELEKSFNYYLKADDKYYHDITCSADRNKPMGCDGCSCEIGHELRDLRTRIKSLEEELNSSNSIREAEKLILIQEIERNKSLEEGIENWLEENNGEDWRERCEANLASAQDQELYNLIKK